MLLILISLFIMKSEKTRFNLMCTNVESISLFRNPPSYNLIGNDFEQSLFSSLFFKIVSGRSLSEADLAEIFQSCDPKRLEAAVNLLIGVLFYLEFMSTAMPALEN